MKARLALFLLASLVAPSTAQEAPFDMTPEGGTNEMQSIAPPSAASPATPAAPAAPSDVRYIVPAPSLRLEGEMAERNFTLELSPEQAASPATLFLGYQNAVVVAPESSQLGVMVNGVRLLGQPILSSGGVRRQSIELPAGLLRAGANSIAISADQRHRTDCTVESTYELWTDIDPASTFLRFADPAANRFAQLEDIRGIGSDASGKTRFTLVAPELRIPAAASAIFDLSQMLALLANMPMQSFVVSEAPGDVPGSGHLPVFIGTAAELEHFLPPAGLPGDGGARAAAGFVDYPGAEGQALVVTGPDWRAIGQFVRDTAASFARTGTRLAGSARGESWSLGEMALLSSGSSLSFADLGIGNREFSGRRFRLSFAVRVPADFYASAYGEARILLDAAYSNRILPGSRIDVNVNGNLASTVPLSETDGAVLNHLPIRVTMRHFRPGVNMISLEAVLLTEEDAVCAPGATASQGSRFAVFNTSEIHMPEFARIGRVPDLAALSGAAFPYGRADEPVALLLSRSDADVYSAAATFLGKLSTVARRPVQLQLVSTPSQIGDRPAIIAGAVADIDPVVLSQMKIATDVGSRWEEPGPETDGDPVVTVDEWRDRINADGWWEAFKAWIRSDFDLTFRTLRFAPPREQDFMPGPASTFLVAQNPGPSGLMPWTLLTAPSASALDDGVTETVSGGNWENLSGRITVYAAGQHRFETVDAGTFSFVPTQPPSFFNYRLIATNWLSDNVMSYSLLLVLATLVLGFATAAVLRRTGRQ